ncbi:MAG: HflC protein [Candidatus Marinimicrobia bacterium]|nr:HflC protein [Candidatus Neomarinimicrobiota bacterium]|tara:strand:- start:9 stop:854 length:846 start_codon:yes stop_codon:yes gene_type:complete
MKNLSIGLLFILIFFGLSTIIIVDETEQIVILQFGKPIKTLKEPGLNWKLPAPLQTANSFEKRLLEYDVPPEEILSRDKKSLIIDNYVRWKIVDPLLFLQTVAAVPTAKTRLDDIVYSELRQELGTHDMVEIITENRELIMDKVTKASNEETSKYGIEVIDVRIRRVDLPKENEASIYARMEAERKRQANKFRSEGEEEAQKIRAATDRDKTVILADAYKTSQKIRGEGEAKALDVYATSFSKDPKFYEFIRTLETFEKVIDDKTTLVLPGDSKLFKELIQ